MCVYLLTSIDSSVLILNSGVSMGKVIEYDSALFRGVRAIKDVYCSIFGERVLHDSFKDEFVIKTPDNSITIGLSLFDLSFIGDPFFEQLNKPIALWLVFKFTIIKIAVRLQHHSFPKGDTLLVPVT